MKPHEQKARALCLQSFNSRPPCDGRQTSRLRTHFGCSFNSRPPCDGRRSENTNYIFRLFQFTPALRRATGTDCAVAFCDVFQFTPALRRATGIVNINVGCAAFQFTPALRRATQMQRSKVNPVVSIHARLATGDLRSGRTFEIGKFQFTPALRRATKR